MEQKSQVDDNISSSDRISHGVASSSDGNKVSTQSQRDTDVSTISSERVQSVQQNSVRSDVSSETGEPLNIDKKLPVADRIEEVSLGDFTAEVPCHYERLKADSFSSKDSGEAVRLSSVDSADPQLYQCSYDNLAYKSLIQQGTSSGYSISTHSNESIHIRQLNSSLVDTKVKPITGNELHRGKCEFDLNEGMEAHGAELPHQSLYELNSSVHATHISKPVPVVAKVGVPVGLPKKPLEFGGELGWRRYADASAFRPTLFGMFVREKGGSGILNEPCPRQLFVSQGFDLNVAASMESELPADETCTDVGLKQPENFLLDLNCRSANNEIHRKLGASGFDLNDNPAIEDMHKTIFQPGEDQQLPRNCVYETATCSTGSGSKYISDCRTPYWADLSCARGLSPIQAQPLLVAAPTAEQVRMMIPIQSDISLLPHAPSEFYIGKINSLSPPFFPPNVLPHLYNQHGAAVVSPLSRPLLAAYPGTVHVLENLQGINPTAYGNVRPTFIQNDGITLLENHSRGANNADFWVPARSTLFDGRMKPIERVAFPASHPKRREPDGGWESSQGNPRRMAHWS